MRINVDRQERLNWIRIENEVGNRVFRENNRNFFKGVFEEEWKYGTFTMAVDEIARELKNVKSKSKHHADNLNSKETFFVAMANFFKHNPDFTLNKSGIICKIDVREIDSTVSIRIEN